MRSQRRRAYRPPRRRFERHTAVPEWLGRCPSPVRGLFTVSAGRRPASHRSRLGARRVGSCDSRAYVVVLIARGTRVAGAEAAVGIVGVEACRCIARAIRCDRDEHSTGFGDTVLAKVHELAWSAACCVTRCRPGREQQHDRRDGQAHRHRGGVCCDGAHTHVRSDLQCNALDHHAKRRGGNRCVAVFMRRS